LEVSELDSLIRNFEKTPCTGISDDTTTERAVCTAALAVGNKLLAQRAVAVLLSSVYHDFTNNVERATDTGVL